MVLIVFSFCFVLLLPFEQFEKKKKVVRRKATHTEYGNEKSLLGNSLLLLFYAQTL